MIKTRLGVDFLPSVLFLYIKNYYYFKIILFIYLLFIFGCAGSSLLRGLFSSCSELGLLPRCGVWVSHCGGFSCRGAWTLWHSLNSCGLVALQHIEPRSETGPMSLALAGRFFNTGTREAPTLKIIIEQLP